MGKHFKLSLASSCCLSTACLKKKSELCGSNWISQEQGRQFSLRSRHPRSLQTCNKHFVTNMASKGFSLKTVWYWFTVYLHTWCKIQANHCVGVYRCSIHVAPWAAPWSLKQIRGFCCSEDAGSYHNTHYTCPASVGTWQTVQPQFPAVHRILVRSRHVCDYCNAILVYQSILKGSRADWAVEGGSVRHEWHLKRN